MLKLVIPHKFPFPRTLLLSSLISGILLSQGCSSLSSGTNQTAERSPQGEHKLSSLPQTDDKSADLVKETLQNSSPKITPKIDTKQEIVQEHYDVVWPEIRSQFHLAQKNMGKYNKFIEFYKKRKKHLETSFQRAEPYLFYIKNKIDQKNMPMELTLLPLVESGFIPTAVSHKRAAGLWQFIPTTGKMYGLDQNWWFDGRADIIKSTDAALSFLEDLHELNDGDWLLALASYNAGYGAVLKAQKRYRKKHPKTAEDTSLTFWQLQPYLPRETARYVPKLLATAHLVHHAKTYNINLHPVNNNPYFDSLILQKQVALPAIAKALKIPNSKLQALNPGYLRSATPPASTDGRYHLLLPTEYTAKFKKLFAQNPEQFTVRWQRYKVKQGDVLGKIALNFKTQVNAIKVLNRLKSSRIRVNQTLLIPIADQRITQNNRTAQRQKAKNMVASSESSQNFVVRSEKSKLIKKHYLIQKGDVLSLIAKQFDVSVQQLKKWNALKTNQIRAGKKLVIWQTPKALKHKNYKVKTGDNLWLIAKNHRVSTKTLANYNALSLKSTLQPGQVLKIPLNS